MRFEIISMHYIYIYLSLEESGCSQLLMNHQKLLLAATSLSCQILASSFFFSGMSDCLKLDL